MSVDMKADELWAEAAHVFPAEDLDGFLVWAWGKGASDVSFQSGSPAMIEIDGRVRRATAAVLDSGTLQGIVDAVHGLSGDGTLRAGEAIDCSYAVRVPGERNRDVRFRCNFSPCLVDHRFGVNATLRVLPGVPPRLEDLDVEEEVAAAFDDCVGLTLVTGVPGSGKTTLLAAGTRRMLEAGIGRIQSYESPVEFVFDDIRVDGAMMSSSEVPRHFRTFAEGLRSSLRRRPAAVVVGEARDRETVEAALRAADFGIAVFSTTHTIGVANTIRRMLAEFRQEERDERGAALVDLLNVVVTQVLLPNPNGGRTAIREWLRFEGGLKAELLESARETWPARISAALMETGNDLVTKAGRAAEEGRIGALDLARIKASRDGAGMTG